MSSPVHTLTILQTMRIESGIRCDISLVPSPTTASDEKLGVGLGTRLMRHNGGTGSRCDIMVALGVDVT